MGRILEFLAFVAGWGGGQKFCKIFFKDMHKGNRSSHVFWEVNFLSFSIQVTYFYLMKKESFKIKVFLFSQD